MIVGTAGWWRRLTGYLVDTFLIGGVAQLLGLSSGLAVLLAIL